jgi:hypothetical protein
MPPNPAFHSGPVDCCKAFEPVIELVSLTIMNSRTVLLFRIDSFARKAFMSSQKGQTFTIKIPPCQSVVTATTTTATSAVITVSSSSPPTPVEPLKTVAYEAGMFFGALEIIRHRSELLQELVLKNAVVENTVLHARSLCEVFLDKPRDKDIRLSKLFPDLRTNPSYTKLNNLVSRLRKTYGKSGTVGSYRHSFNTMVMHTTEFRGAYGLYDKPLRELEPIIREIVSEIEFLKGVKFTPITSDLVH